MLLCKNAEIICTVCDFLFYLYIAFSLFPFTEARPSIFGKTDRPNELVFLEEKKNWSVDHHGVLSLFPSPTPTPATSSPPTFEVRAFLNV